MEKKQKKISKRNLKKVLDKKKLILAIIVSVLSVVTICGAIFVSSFSKRNPTILPPDEFEVVFYSNGGTEVNEQKNLKEGDVISIEPLSTREYYTFVGWFDNIELEGERVSFPLTIKKSLTLFAKWEMNTTKLSSFVIDKNTETITRFVGSETDVKLPTSFSLDESGQFVEGDNYQLTRLSANAFLNNYTIKNVVIPNEFNNIGTRAFANCKNLLSAKIESGDNLTTIPEFMFENCVSLASFFVPKSVSSIGVFAFSGCFELKSFSVDRENTSFCAVENNLYSFDKSILVRYAPAQSAREFVCFDGVREIAMNAFRDSLNLKDVTLADSVDIIGSYAFSGCSNIENLTLPFVGHKKNLTGDALLNEGLFGYIFGTDNYLGSIKIDQYKTQTAHYSYFVPRSLKSVTITNSATLASSSFYGMTTLKSVSLPDCMTEIGNNAFYGCSNIENIFVPNNIERVEDAFGGCNNLNLNLFDNGYYLGSKTNAYRVFVKAKNSNISSISINKSARVIPDNAFKDFLNLNSVVFPYNSELVNIGENAFYGCTKLTSFVAPSGLKYLGQSAFKGCSKLESVRFDCLIEEIPSNEFSGCVNLKNASFDSLITKIGNNAFYGCCKLSDPIFNEGLLTISDLAFYGCRNIHKFVVPSSVTQISNTAFKGCYRLAEIFDLTINRPNDQHISVNCSGDEDGYIGYYADVVHNFLNEGHNNGSDLFVENGIIYVYLYDGEGSLVCKKAVGPVDENCLSINLASDLNEIRKFAFLNCERVSEIVFPNSIQKIDKYAFKNCTGLKVVSFLEDSNLSSFGEGAFSGCGSIGEMTLPFVGLSLNTVNIPITYGDMFGAIFGTEPYDGGAKTNCAYDGSTYSFVIPTSLYSVKIWKSNFYYDDINTIYDIVNQDGVVHLLTSYAFRGCENIVEIELPTDLEMICYSAFENCYSLCSLTFYPDVWCIEENAFKNCYSLVEVYDLTSEPYAIDATVGKNKTYAIYGFFGEKFLTMVDSYLGENLKVVHKSLSEESNIYISNDGVVYFVDQTEKFALTVLKHNEKFAPQLEEGCTGINKYAFANSSILGLNFPEVVLFDGLDDCTFLNTKFLNSLVIPKEIIYFGERLFESSAIKTLLFEEGSLLTSIPKYCFMNTPNILEIFLPKGVEAIGYKAFYNSNLKNMSFESDSTLQTIADYAFYGSNISTFEVLSKVSAIGEYAFSKSKITEVVFDEGCLQNIKNHCFFECKNLTKVIISSNIEVVETHAFCFCDNLKEVLFNPGSKLRLIESYGFHKAYALTTINFGSNLERIEEGAFGGCSNLSSVSFGSNSKLSYVGKNAFLDCTSLLGVAFDKNIEEISEGAFKNCTSLKTFSVSLEANLQTIGESAFYNTDLRDVTLPETLKEIGALAFFRLKNWQNVDEFGLCYIKSPSNDHYYLVSFMGSDKEVIEINDNCKFIASYTFYYEGSRSREFVMINDVVKKIVVPSSVETIGLGAFASLSSLAELDLYFVGKSKTTILNDEKLVGYMFGKKIFDGAVNAMQTYLDENEIEKNVWYYRPASLSKVVLRFSEVYQYAFCGYNVNEVLFEGTQKIGLNAFKNCSLLSKVVLGENLSVVEENAFDGCLNLLTVFVDSQTILNQTESAESFGKVFLNATTIFVKENLNASSSSLLASDYEEVVSDTLGYKKFVKKT